MDTLQHIQALQFSDKAAAEALLLEFLRANYPFDAVAVELRPLAVSLNSFNGIMTLADGSRLFFKTHIESDGVIDEYYHAALLAEAGYPVLSPIYASKKAGNSFWCTRSSPTRRCSTSRGRLRAGKATACAN
ncbi:MAG: hypothetical protein U0521_24885 [Anaerolineae bacterium]